MSPGCILTGIWSRFFALDEFVLGINVVAGTMGGRGEREIGSRALLAGLGARGELGGSTNGQGREPRLGGKLADDNVKFE